MKKKGVVLIFEGPYGAGKMPTRVFIKIRIAKWCVDEIRTPIIAPWGSNVELGSLMIMRKGFAPIINSLRRAEELLLVEICTCESEL